MGVDGQNLSILEAVLRTVECKEENEEVFACDWEPRSPLLVFDDEGAADDVEEDDEDGTGREEIVVV